MKQLIDPLARQFVPRLYWRRRLRYLQNDNHEPELRLVAQLADRTKTSVDVGAAGGLFVAHMLRYSRDCVAFEPRPVPAADLEDMARALALPVRVERAALSNATGVARLRILTSDLGRSTIEPNNHLEDPDGSARTEIDVPMRRLDDCTLGDVGFIKIDVEGHEIAVLEGARETIDRNRCNLLIEVENRHKPMAVEHVFELMRGKEYAGFFLIGRDLLDIESFDVDVHQNSANIGGWKSGWRRSGIYINNFIFVPMERRERVKAAVISK